MGFYRFLQNPCLGIPQVFFVVKHISLGGFSIMLLVHILFRMQDPCWPFVSSMFSRMSGLQMCVQPQVAKLQQFLRR
jgi:hypothetical protein